MKTYTYKFFQSLRKTMLKKLFFSIIGFFIIIGGLQAQTSNECDAITSFPYIEKFTAASQSLDCWTIIDVNKDGEAHPNYPNGKWTFKQDAAKYTFSNNDLTADDWLISPKISVIGNLEIKFQHKVQKNNRAEKFSVWVITGNPYNYANATNILETKTIGDENYSSTAAISIPPDFITQDVYIGIRCESDSNGMGLYIDNFSVNLNESETYTLTASVVNDENGTISPKIATVAKGGQQEFTITPIDDNYEVEELIDNEKSKKNEIIQDKYTIYNIDTIHNIQVKFKKKSYILTASVVNGNGSINPKTIVVDKGDSQEFTIKPDEGYELEELKDNGENKTPMDIDNKYRLENIIANHDIKVKFKSATSIKSLEDISVNIYPIPTNDFLNIKASDKISHIEIISIDGKLLDKQNVNSNNYRYNTNSLAEGNYFVRIYSENKNTIKQFSIKK